MGKMRGGSEVMLNYWWVTRPKRKLNSVPEVLATFADLELNREWDGQRESHLAYEDALEKAGLKRKGDRRDQTGGGARTYKAWLESLGLIFVQKNTKKIKLTMAGEAIMKGDSPVNIISNQIFKYQFPSSFSLGRGVQVSSRFKIHPFIFLLRLLYDSEIEYLTEEEIAKIIITEAENESDKCYFYIKERILLFRDVGDKCLENNFFEKYCSSKGKVNPDHPFSHLLDIANTLVNWMEYTQLVKRVNNKVYILNDKRYDAEKILNNKYAFIDRPEEHEYFQRKYGLDLIHKKDLRNLNETKTITPIIIARQKVMKAYITESLIKPITKITNELIESISDKTGIEAKIVEDILMKNYPQGSISAFMTKYFEMAFKGRDKATEFEKATKELFQEVFNFTAQHVGPIGLTPDVLLVSESAGYQAIIDNKAYESYTITNDHKNRMIYNYIKHLDNYSKYNKPLAFFAYISGGFGKNIDSQIKDIHRETKVNGSAISVSNIIKMVETNATNRYNHLEIKEIFSVNRQILISDLK